MKRKPLVTWFPFRFALLIAPLVAAWPQAAYADQIWDGGGADNNWNTAANWGANTLPTFTNAITFTGNLRNAAANNLAADSTIGGINLTNTGAAGLTNVFTLSGNRITLGGNITTTANTAGTTITDTISLAMILNGNRTITTNQQSATVQHNLTISGIISQDATARTLTKAGGGILLLSGANSYAGATTVSAGTLRAGNALAFGTTAGGVSITAGAVVDLNGQVIGAEAFTLNATGISSGGALINSSGTASSLSGTINLASNSSLGGDGTGLMTLSGVISGAGTLTKVGTGTTLLSGANTYATATTVSAGTLRAGNALAFGTTAGGVSITAGAVVDLNGQAIGAEAFTLNGAGISSGGALINAGNAASSLSGAVNLASASSIGTTGAMTLSGVISGTAAITKVGSGVLNLSGTNTYNGGTTISAGTLSFLNTNAKSASGTHAFSAGTTLGLGVSGASAFTATDLDNAFAGSMTGNLSNVTITGTTNIGIDTTNGSFTYASVVPASTTSGLVKLGGNTLTLSGANTYTTPTSIVAGTLSAAFLNSVVGGTTSSSLGAPTTAATGTISLGLAGSTGTLSYTGAGETTDRVVNLAGTTGGGALDNSGSGTVTYSSPMTFTGTGVKTLTVSGASNTTLGAGLLGGATVNGVASTSALTLAKTGTGTLLLGAPGSALNTNTVAVLNIAGGVVDIGTSGLTLSNGGGTVIDSSVNATINGTGGGVLTISSIAGNGGGDIRPAAGTILTINAVVNTPVTNAAFWTGQGGALELNNSGTLVLTNTNTIGGNVIITAAGTISVGSIANNLGGATGFVFNTAGSRLLYTGSSETSAIPITINANSTVDMSGTGTLTLSAANVTVTGASNKTFTLQGSTAGTGVMSSIIPDLGANTTAITKAGTGTWSLSGANTYTGATTVNAGNLVLVQGGGSVLGNTGIVINSGGTLSPQAGFNVGNNLATAAGGRLTLSTGGTLNLADGTIGNLNLVQGATFVGNAATFSGGTINFDVGTTAGTNDMIDVLLNNVSGTGLATSSGSNGIAINPTGGSLGLGNYTLINAAGTLNNANFYLASPNVLLGGTLYNLSLSQSGTNQMLTVATGGPAVSPATAFWAGTTNASWSLGGAGTATNWSSIATSTVDPAALPGATTNVSLTANAVAGGGLSTTLDGNYTINSLNFTSGATANAAGSTVAPGSGGALTINAAAVNGNVLGSGLTVAAGSGANTISTNVVLGSSQTWTSNASTATTVSGVVSDGGNDFGLTLAGTGTGTFTLTNANTYGGVTALTGSVLRITNGSALGSTAAGTTQAGTSALEIDGTGGAVIVGDEALTINGGGISNQGALRNIAGDNTYGGTVTMAAQSRINSDSGTLTLNNATAAVTATNLTLVVGGAGNVTIAGPITIGTGGVSKADGAGTLTLSGANTYTGATTVSAGTVKVGSATAFGSAGIGNGALSMGGTGVFDLNGFNAAVTNVSASTATSNITNSGTSDVTLAVSSQANAIGSLVTDGGTNKLAVTLRNNNFNTAGFTLGSLNTFSGGLTLVDGTTLGAGTRLVINGAITGTPFGTGAITVGSAATDKAGIFFSTADNTLSLPLVLNTSQGTDRFGIRNDGRTITLSGLITANADAVFSSNSSTASNTIITNKVTGAGGLAIDLSQTGTAATLHTVTLNTAANVNDYSGDTIVGRTGAVPSQNYTATLVLGASDQIPHGAGKGNVILTNDTVTRTGTLNLAGFSDTINGLSGNGTLEGGTSGTPTLTVGDGNAPGNFSGIIQNTGSTLTLAKIGTGTQTLSGANTFGGPLNVNGGLVAFATSPATSGPLGNSAVVNLSGGGLSYTGSTANPLNRPVVIGAGNGTLNVSDSLGNLTIASVTSTGGNLIKTGTGTATLAGSTSLNGGLAGVTVSEGTLVAGFGSGGISTLTVGASGILSLNNSAVESLTLGGTPGALTLAGGSRLGFELTNLSTNDSIAVGGGGTASTTGIITFDFFGSVAAGTYNLLSAPGGLNTATYALGAAPNGFNYTINTSPTLVSLTTSAYTPIYWNGAANASWNTLNTGASFNWTTDAAGTIAAGSVPGTADTVIFSTTVAPFTSGSIINTALNAAFTVDSVQFLAAPAGITGVTVQAGTGGTLNLSPVSTSGGIRVFSNAGNVDLQAPMTIGTSQTWDVDGTGANGSSLTISGNTAFNANVTKTGAGVLTLGGNNGGTGNIALTGGTLNINSNTALGTSGTLSIGAGTTIDSTAAGVTVAGNAQTWNGSFAFTGTNSLNLGSGAVTLAANTTLTAAANTLTVGGVIGETGGARTLIKAGNGTLVLNGNNTFSGGATINAGTLVMNDAGAPGSGNFTVNGGAIDATVPGITLNAVPTTIAGSFGFTGTNNLNLGTGAITLTATPTITTTANTLTLGGSISGGTFGLIKAGNGNLVMSNPSYVGVTTVNAGQLTIAGGTVGGGTTAITVGGASPAKPMLLLTGGMASGRILAGNGAGLSGAIHQSAGTVNAAGTSTLDNFYGSGVGGYGFYQLSAGNLNSTAYMVFGSGGGGTGVFYQTGGAVALSGAGWFQTGYGSAAGSNGVAYLAGGTFSVGGTNALQAGGFQSIAGTRGEITLAGTDVTSTTNILFGHSNSTGGTGVINLNSGTLQAPNIAEGVAAVTSVLNFNGATFKPSAANTLTGLNNAFVQSGGAIIDTSLSSFTIGQALLAPAGDGVATIPVASGGSGYIGAPYVQIAGGSSDATAVAIMADDGTGNGTFTVSSIVVTNPGTGYAAVPSVTLAGGSATSAATVATVTTAANTSGGLTKINANTLTLSGANTYTGTTTISGGTLQLGAAGTTGALSPSSSIVNNGIFATNRTNAVVQGTDFSTAAITGTGGFTKLGSGTTTLNAANAFTGPTTITAGILSVPTIADIGTASPLGLGDSATALTNTTSLVFNGGSLEYTGPDATTNRGFTLTAAGTILLPTAGTDLTFGGNVSGSGTLILGVNNSLTSSTSSLRLTGDNSAFTGNVTVRNGNLFITNSNQLGTGTKTVTVQVNTSGFANLSLDGTSGDITLPASVSFVTSLQNTSSILNVAGNNTINGNFSLTSGNGGTRFESNGGSLTLAGNIAAITGGRVAFLEGTAAGTVSGVISDGTYASPTAMGVTKSGIGTWTLTGTNTYKGATTVSQGTLIINGDHTAATGAINVASGATLGGSGTLGGALTVAAGGIFAPGTSPGTMTTSGSVSFDAASILNYEFVGNNTTVGGGVNDLLTGVTNLTLGGTLNVTEIGAGSFLLANLGDMWRIMNYSGTLTGTLAVGTAPALLDPTWSLAVDTTMANQVNLVVVPETSAVSLLGLATLFTLRRRRSVKAA